ncbi:uncharacterized protein CDAR_514831 [Caerostris darwini]|uniref:Uncharacterized protein n=1 Tax=Caerostris darwini TaxID=1538125 RepID=A0AAV4SHH6_9ARAC|nr:uncharacterized protein CDAR_514831 [Caerostris darwini]
MNSPKLHDLESYSKPFEFVKYGFYKLQWEICVPQKDCIIWGVVLSYLRSADFRTSRSFETRLKRLTEGTFDPQIVKPIILKFNCFLNIHACFFQEILKKICLSFKTILDKKRTTSFKNINQELQTISNVLNSNILLVRLQSRNITLFRSERADDKADVAVITLFFKEYTAKDGDKEVLTKRFTFGLSEKFSWPLRQNALHNILKTSSINSKSSKEIKELIEKKEKQHRKKKLDILKRESFVIFLLKNNYINLLSELYESPYIARKFANAGFETDPRIVDSKGLSAFYYAMCLKDRNLVYMLYRYAANSCYESENTFRNPNSCIISNFQKLEKIIQDDLIQFQSNNYGDQARLASEELELFNKFLTEVSKEICNIREEPIGNSVEEASKQKRIILHILEVFDNYFSISQQLDSNISEAELIENYMKHKCYYDNLDFTVTLLFFDNIFLLKGMLQSPQSNLYSELESNFLLLTLTNKYFTSEAKHIENKYGHIIKLLRKQFQNMFMNLESNSEVFYIMPLLERFHLRKNIKNFCQILKSSKMETVKCIPKAEIFEMLSNSTEVKDEFLIFRLHHYLTTALKKNSSRFKLKFVIERALQVIGESIKVENENPHTLKYLLRSCLPVKTVSTLLQIRNTLSHLESFQFSLKFEKEQDDAFFDVLQSELQSINKAFEVVFDIQKVRLIEFLINRGLQALQTFQELKKPTATSDNLCSIKESVEGIKKTLERSTSQSLEKHFPRYKTLWRNTLQATQTLLDKIENTSNSLESIVKQIDDITYPLFYLMTFLQNTCQINEDELLNDIFQQKEALSCCQPKDKWKKTKDLMTKLTDWFECRATETFNVFIPCIEKFNEILQGKYIYENEKKEIFEQALELTKDHIEAKDKLIEDLKEGAVLDLKRFDKLFLSDCQKQNLKEKYKKYLKVLEDMKQSNKIQQSEMYLEQSNENQRKDAVHLKLTNKAGSEQLNKILQQEQSNKIEQTFEVNLQQSNETYIENRNEQSIEIQQSYKVPSEKLNATKQVCEKHLERSHKTQLEKLFDAIITAIKAAINPLDILELIFAKKYVSQSKLQLMHNEIGFTDNTKKKLSKLMENSKPLDGDNLANLLNCINSLKKICIDERHDINFLWENAKSKKTKEYLGCKIVHRYFQEYTFQASIEMLLFDCVSILEKVDDFESFCLKTSYLFNGIDVRNVLAHGDPLLESIGGILDPQDFPLELVKKMLQLFEDQASIIALHDLWQKRKQIMDSSSLLDNSECIQLKEKIICCEDWGKYFKLILTKDLEKNEKLIYEKIVTFLSEIQPK